jgi:AMMECR1 domain-containing protein
MRWTARRFLEETCVKAGFDPGVWREPETEIQAFTAEVFSESEIHSGKTPGPGGRAKSRYSIST